MPTGYCFDGSNLGFRAQCVHPDLSSDGFPTGAIYGVLKILTTFMREFSVGRFIIPFDFSKSDYRKSVSSDYKAHRKGDPRMAEIASKFQQQINVIYDILGKLGAHTIGPEGMGYEADDIIAYIVHRFIQGDFPGLTSITIISSDKDLCALIQPSVIWYNPIKKELITHKNFEEVFGVKIHQYPDFKRLKGDVSDGIWHPPGIGEKGAAKLLKEYGSIEEMQKIKLVKLLGHEEQLAKTKKLVDLDLHIKFPMDPIWNRIDESLRRKICISSENEILEILRYFKFDSFLEVFDSFYTTWQSFSEAPFSA